LSNSISKSQIDRLGERIRNNDLEESDLLLLDSYRRSFAPAYETVITAVQQKLTLYPTGRPAKTTRSITEKLRREHIRLSQIQDIAGCRLVVRGLSEQDWVVENLGAIFDNRTVVDRRIKPSYGYRAVHVVVRTLDRVNEIQVRTDYNMHGLSSPRNSQI